MDSPVIFFDGVCNLCTGSVQFILKRDHKKIFRFASLQGEAGRMMLLENDLSQDQLKTLVLNDGEKIYTRSTAALMVAKELSGLWPLFYALIIVPRALRDGVYNIISNNRYKWFGKKEVCWIPDPKWSNRFLD
jgi:predicted DCC family thiol-disulfide oxidoreductase YuxK